MFINNMPVMRNRIPKLINIAMKNVLAMKCDDKKLKLKKNL